MDGHLRFFPGYLHLFPGKIRSYFWPQNAQSAKMPKVVQLHSCGEKPLKKTEISQISIYLFFRGYRILYIYIYTHIIIYIYSHLCQLQVSLLETPVLLVRTSFLLLYSTFFLRWRFRVNWSLLHTDASWNVSVQHGRGDTFWVRGGSFKIFTLTWDGGRERER